MSINGKEGYINKLGQFLVEPKFEKTLGFSEGFAWVRIGKKYGYIDTTGKLVLKRINYET